MQRVAVYHSVLEAQRAASFLLERGVPVRVFSQPGDAAMINQVLGRGTHELHAADRVSADHARELLEQLDDTPPEPEDGWEDATAPDLTRLPTGLAVPCAVCGFDLRPEFDLQGPEGACPACGELYDGAERVVHIHGPEALADCYPEIDAARAALPPPEEALAQRVATGCLRCGYRLDGLPVRGRCPECGLNYDKAAQLRGLLDP